MSGIHGCDTPTYPAEWKCYGCGEVSTLTPGETFLCDCGRGVYKIRVEAKR